MNKATRDLGDLSQASATLLYSLGPLYFPRSVGLWVRRRQPSPRFSPHPLFQNILIYSMLTRSMVRPCRAAQRVVLFVYWHRGGRDGTRYHAQTTHRLIHYGPTNGRFKFELTRDAPILVDTLNETRGRHNGR